MFREFKSTEAFLPYLSLHLGVGTSHGGIFSYDLFI